jgi:hypothetical protein
MRVNIKENVVRREKNDVCWNWMELGSGVECGGNGD